MKVFKKVLDQMFLAKHRMTKMLEENPDLVVPKSVNKVFAEVSATFSILNKALNIIDDEQEEVVLKSLKNKNEKRINKTL
jgi:hypothetical protein